MTPRSSAVAVGGEVASQVEEPSGIMRRSVWYIVVAVLWLGPAGQPVRAELQPGQEAPDFVLKSLQGRNLRLSEFRGNVVLLNFWAEWCNTCRDQLPELQQLHERYRQAGLVLLGVSLGDDTGHAGEAARAQGATYDVLADPDGQVSRLYGIDKMPVTVLIDRDGNFRQVYQGTPPRGNRSYVDELRNLLKE